MIAQLFLLLYGFGFVFYAIALICQLPKIDEETKHLPVSYWLKGLVALFALLTWPVGLYLGAKERWGHDEDRG